MNGRRTMWVGHATGRVLVVSALLVLGFAGFLAATHEWVPAVISLLAAGLVAAFSRVTVVVDRRGVTVLYSRLRWPRTVIALDDVIKAETTSLSPVKWGGWGYRGSRKAIGHAAVLIRRGPALQLAIADGTKLSVSVDRPENGVTALSRLIGERT